MNTKSANEIRKELYPDQEFAIRLAVKYIQQNQAACIKEFGHEMAGSYLYGGSPVNHILLGIRGTIYDLILCKTSMFNGNAIGIRYAQERFDAADTHFEVVLALMLGWDGSVLNN